MFKFLCICCRIRWFLIKKIQRQSDGVKAATKYDIGKKWISKAKKLEKKNKDAKAKKAYEKAIKYLLEANSQNPVDPDI